MTESPEPQSSTHELRTFLDQDLQEMKSEYDRIHARSVEDPGTAGDEGEETWAELLRNWLPESYSVVTKGRVLAASGQASPQLDVLVLRPSYPKRLKNKKLYLAGGVAAAFECKNTLKAEHLKTSFDQARALDELSPLRPETPFGELVPTIFFGVLAHSTVWKSEPAKISVQIDKLLREGLGRSESIRHSPSLVCVADLHTWSALRSAYDGPGIYPDSIWDIRRTRGNLPAEGCFSFQYNRFVEGPLPEEHAPFNAIAAAIAVILGRLAHDDVSCRPLSQYLFSAGLQGMGLATTAQIFTLDEYSDRVRSGLPRNLTNGVVGSEWSLGYNF